MENIVLPKDFVQLLLGHFISGAHEHSRATEFAVKELQRHMSEAAIPKPTQEVLISWAKEELGDQW